MTVTRVSSIPLLYRARRARPPITGSGEAATNTGRGVYICAARAYNREDAGDGPPEAGRPTHDKRLDPRGPPRAERADAGAARRAAQLPRLDGERLDQRPANELSGVQRA